MHAVKENPETIVCSQDVVSVIIFVFMENIHCFHETLFSEFAVAAVTPL